MLPIAVPTASGAVREAEGRDEGHQKATVRAPAKLPMKTRPQLRSTPPIVTPGRLSRQRERRQNEHAGQQIEAQQIEMEKPTGNSMAPTSGWPVCTLIVTANHAASARMAPAM